MASGEAITVDGLHVRRGGKEVLHGLSFSVARGRVTGLLGPSGCGKTTLMRALVGVQMVEAGRVSVLGHPAGSRELRSRVGYVTQAPSVYRDLTVRENLRFFGRVLGVRQGRIDEVIETVALGGEADRVVGRLSGGSRPGPRSPPRCSAIRAYWFSTSRRSASTRSCAAIYGRHSPRLRPPARRCSSPVT